MNTSGARRALWAALLLTVVLYVLPFGRLLLWPLTLFATFVHEMGHGIAGLLVGGSFDSFRLWANGSGMASVSGVPSGVASAIVSAGGLLGPTLAGALLFMVARRSGASRAALFVGAVVLLIADLVFVRNLFGFLFVAALALAAAGVAWRTSAAGAQVAVVLVAMQLCLSVFSDIGYMFSRVAKTAGGTVPSDTANMATQLGGYFWLWGGVTATLSLLAALSGVALFLRATRE